VLRAGRVVLAAGGIGSPRLLRASGLLARPAAFFSDPVVAVMGSVDDLGAMGNRRRRSADGGRRQLA
jgi:choline dehydrogenase-like flavoprotein